MTKPSGKVEEVLWYELEECVRREDELAAISRAFAAVRAEQRCDIHTDRKAHWSGCEECFNTKVEAIRAEQPVIVAQGVGDGLIVRGSEAAIERVRRLINAEAESQPRCKDCGCHYISHPTEQPRGPEADAMVAIDWQGMIFGLLITLTCPRCNAVCPMENPFHLEEHEKPSLANNFQLTDFPAKISEAILEASKNHRISGCNFGT